jgi:hypothetical protein
MNGIIKISIDDLDLAEKEILATKVYSEDIICARELVHKFPRHDGDVIETVSKIAVIDVLNNTQTFRSKSTVSILKLAKLINNIKDIDERLKVGDVSLVTEIAEIYQGRKLYSFASKYCTIHNQEVYEKDAYAKYDNVVVKNLPRFIKTTKKSYIKKYDVYMKKIDQVISDNGLHGIPFIRRKIDQYIWWKYRK